MESAASILLVKSAVSVNSSGVSAFSLCGLRSSLSTLSVLQNSSICVEVLGGQSARFSCLFNFTRGASVLIAQTAVRLHAEADFCSVLALCSEDSSFSLRSSSVFGFVNGLNAGGGGLLL